MNNNPPTKSIDISTQEGLDLLRIKAKYYGHYAEFLKVVELIDEIEQLRADPELALHEANKLLGW
jgi:hypothetical protein